MRYRAILFDMDGTLVPMDNDVFTKGYFHALAEKLSPVGLAPDALMNTVWAGTKAMIKNDGSQTNDTVFWDTFVAVTGKEVQPFRTASDHFYSHEFGEVKGFTGENPLAWKAVEAAHAAAEKVVCASNPLFPLNGQLMRMRWVGLQQKDFDLITSYESDRFCKPNPAYYEDICRRLQVKPEECLMIGNDVLEDMQTASSLGMDTFLVTDCIIPHEGIVWEGKQGSFADLVNFLKTLA